MLMTITSTPRGGAFVEPFHIAAYPPLVCHSRNPYFVLLQSALAKRGISVSDDVEIDVRWLRAQAGRVKALHLHWPERFWRRGRFGGLSRLGRAAVACHRLLQLRRFIRAARRRRVLCMWTV